MTPADRTYWSQPGRSWHAYSGYEGLSIKAACGRFAHELRVNTADRLPPSAHLCGSCARVIAARTDIEPRTKGLRALAADTEQNGLY